ncbi:hypothetical protein [Bordetella genomosp. 13]|uniref:hypothetical protein n=1 Tax=Bordetella genomosp. 13 TaxID=463040 RepID=UPI0011AA2E2B|nr:hypothetical protein [Bordetella genomosp. 13]
MSENSDALRQAADRLHKARRAFERGERGLLMLRRSRTAFIHSLRNTGLTYAQALVKYDNCIDEQQRIHQYEKHQLQHAERQYQTVVEQARKAGAA